MTTWRQLQIHLPSILSFLCVCMCTYVHTYVRMYMCVHVDTSSYPPHPHLPTYLSTCLPTRVGMSLHSTATGSPLDEEAFIKVCKPTNSVYNHSPITEPDKQSYGPFACKSTEGRSLISPLLSFFFVFAKQKTVPQRWRNIIAKEIKVFTCHVCLCMCVLACLCLNTSVESTKLIYLLACCFHHHFRTSSRAI